MMTDISHRTNVVNLLDASGDGTVDLFGYESCMFAYMGVGIGATTFTVKHGDDKDALEDCDPLCLVPEEAAADASLLRLGYIGARRYVKVTPSATPTAAVAVLQRPDVCPVTKDDGTNI